MKTVMRVIQPEHRWARSREDRDVWSSASHNIRLSETSSWEDEAKEIAIEVPW